MNCYYVRHKKIEDGLRVSTYTLQNGVKIPVIRFGEKGRGRREENTPVKLLPESHAKWEAGEEVCLLFAKIGQTRAGKPKIIECNANDEENSIIVLLDTYHGFRGANEHTGDRSPDWTKENRVFLPFPGKIIGTGGSADGIAGRMARSDQILAVIPKNKVFRARRTGRLYGEPDVHYYCHINGQLLTATAEEREMSDIF